MRWRALKSGASQATLVLYVSRALVAWCASQPLLMVTQGALEDRRLFEPGGLWVAELIWQGRATLGPALAATATLLVTGWLTLQGVGYAARGALDAPRAAGRCLGRWSWSVGLATRLGRRLVLLNLLVWLPAFAVLLLLGLLAWALSALYTGAPGGALIAGGVGLGAAALVVGLAGALHDLAFARWVRDHRSTLDGGEPPRGASTWESLVEAARLLRAHLGLVLGARLALACAAVALVLGAGAGVGHLDVHEPGVGRVRAAAALHQSVALGLAALTVTWWALMRWVARRAERASAAPPATTGGE